jgi:N-acetylneuraminate synthase
VGDVTLLHCTSAYPAPPESVNLRAIDTLAQTFGLPVGYSDHTEGITVAIAAVARGAVVIEKHLTTDRTLPGPDHAASLEPQMFADLVAGIRPVEQSLGASETRADAVEADSRMIVRRSLVAARDLSPDRPITEGDLTLLRPGSDLTPSTPWDWHDRLPKRGYRSGDRFDG